MELLKHPQKKKTMKRKGGSSCSRNQLGGKKFKSNKIPRFSPYHHKNRRNNLLTDCPRYISEEEAMYNAVKACNLPFGLLQPISKL